MSDDLDWFDEPIPVPNPRNVWVVMDYDADWRPYVDSVWSSEDAAVSRAALLAQPPHIERHTVDDSEGPGWGDDA